MRIIGSILATALVLLGGGVYSASTASATNKSIDCSIAVLEPHRALQNGDHINIDIRQGDKKFQINAYVDRNIAGGYKNLGLRLNTPVGALTQPLSKNEVEGGRLTFFYGKYITGAWVTEWAQFNNTYFNQDRKPKSFLNCGTPVVTPEPTPEPTPDPTDEPTKEPTPEPTDEPTDEPTVTPTPEPTPEPTDEPTKEPTSPPTTEPTSPPTTEPSTPTPTTPPTDEPTDDPSNQPTDDPSTSPSSPSTSTPAPTTNAPSPSPSVTPSSSSPKTVVPHSASSTPATVHATQSSDTESLASTGSNGLIAMVATFGVLCLGGLALLIYHSRTRRNK